MLRHILPLMPKHELYAEVFCGGAAVFWAKDPSRIEVLNDTNGELTNFYSVVQLEYDRLAAEIQATLHSRRSHQFAHIVYANSEFFNPVRRAWAVWTLANQSYLSKLNGTWGYERAKETSSSSISKTVDAKRERWSIAQEDTIAPMAARLKHVQVECKDALYIIGSRDASNSFFYLDPPYIGTNCGHYEGYSDADYRALLESLSSIQGKFMLSCFPTDLLTEFAQQNRWTVKAFDQTLSATKTAFNEGRNKRKTELLVLNY